MSIHCARLPDGTLGLHQDLAKLFGAAAGRSFQEKKQYSVVLQSSKGEDGAELSVEDAEVWANKWPMSAVQSYLVSAFSIPC